MYSFVLLICALIYLFFNFFNFIKFILISLSSFLAYPLNVFSRITFVINNFTVLGFRSLKASTCCFPCSVVILCKILTLMCVCVCASVCLCVCVCVCVSVSVYVCEEGGECYHPPWWFPVNNSETVKVVTLAFWSIF